MYKNVLKIFGLALFTIACAGPKSPQDRLTVNDKKIDRIIAQMTLEEKVQMLHSKTIMSSEGVPRLGIQDIKYADGPFGVREEVGDGFRPKGWQTDSATYFPTGSALAATWSPDMAYACGNGIGEEARLRGKDVMLGPAINIQRLPVGGRSYEYLSEDPVLSAALAVGYVSGMQDAGTAACIKHFAVNNQETNRGSVDAQVDERTLREIYLKPFEAAVRVAGAMSVMPAYNKVNGYYCSENEHLLNEILRGEWGFKGFTVSDWGGTHSTMGAALHGLNVQMTGDNYLGQPVIDSIKAGVLSEKVVDDKVRELLRVRFAVEPIAEDQANTKLASRPESRQAALDIARKSIVLLKNDDSLLPVSKSVKKIAVIGQNAVLNTQSGGVGAGVKSPYEVTPLMGIQRRAGNDVEIVYAPGYKNFPGRRWGPAPATVDPLVATAIDEPADPALLAEAVAAAQDADLVFFFAGTNKSIETEGSDRRDIKLPVGQEEVAAALAEANPNLVTVIISGGPCDLQEVVKSSKAMVQGWWNGIEGGTALAEVLFGDIAPSGKLPFTFPVKLEDSPAYAMGNFPNADPTGGDLFTERYRQDITAQQGRRAQRPSPESKYTEGSLVGYRWFDTKNVPVMYAFGHGLSYVGFEYGPMKVSAGKKAVKVTFDITNTGSMAADEVVQLYVSRLDSKVEWPAKELKAFERVSLGAGETKSVTLEIPADNLRYWNVDTNAWTLEHGRLELLLGSASDDIRQKAETKI
ncbi:MAG: glycoside hydrolase family 3 C-terminal domain-containing protein [Bacteroidales bacterium]|nr:glycoside hydrolase family 3 C-terminal domain-containing protein [Bacteroidales bacterium]MBR5054325.1 glycoside hydrolase family 3 C-terminal domain-containing protein [Bacteroidales bacterium]